MNPLHDHWNNNNNNNSSNYGYNGNNHNRIYDINKKLENNLNHCVSFMISWIIIIVNLFIHTSESHSLHMNNSDNENYNNENDDNNDDHEISNVSI